MVPTGRSTAETPASVVDSDKAAGVKAFSDALMPHAEGYVESEVAPEWAALRKAIVTQGRTPSPSQLAAMDRVTRAVLELPGKAVQAMAAGVVFPDLQISNDAQRALDGLVQEMGWNRQGYAMEGYVQRLRDKIRGQHIVNEINGRIG